jgi:hypothetical protein
MNRPVTRTPTPRAGRRSRRVEVAVAALCAVLVLGAGRGESDQPERVEPLLAEIAGSTPTAGQLVGTWREEGERGPALIRFAHDGTFAIDTDALDVPYYAAGTYELKEDTVSFVSNGPGCASSWEWRVGFVTGGGRARDELDVVFLSAWCQQLRGAEHRFARVGP